MTEQDEVVVTDRLELRQPRLTDVQSLFTILSDARVWAHYPSLRHTTRDRTESVMHHWLQGRDRHGLDTWVVRRRDDDEVIGYGGCSVVQDQVWNLGHRLTPDAQGNGYATELAFAAIARARRNRPELPVVADLVEHNSASANVAQKVGSALVDRRPDRGDPDPTAVRLVFADRPVTSTQLTALGH